MVGISKEKIEKHANVPYDPYLDNVFDGEELVRGFQFFTDGYNIYNPYIVAVIHDYLGNRKNPFAQKWQSNHLKKSV